MNVLHVCCFLCMLPRNIIKPDLHSIFLYILSSIHLTISDLMWFIERFCTQYIYPPMNLKQMQKIYRRFFSWDILEKYFKQVYKLFLSGIWVIELHALLKRTLIKPELAECGCLYAFNYYWRKFSSWKIKLSLFINQFWGLKTKVCHHLVKLRRIMSDS